MLAIVGLGLVSPFGRTAREHVFFLRADVPAGEAPPFERADGEPVRLYFCPWLDAGMEIGPRIAALANAALHDALAPLVQVAGTPPPLSIALGLSAPRIGFDARAETEIRAALETAHRPLAITRVTGETSAFGALVDAQRKIAADPEAVIAIVSADSFVALPWLTHLVRNPPTRWEQVPYRPSECAAAIVVTSATMARRARFPILGNVQRVALALGASNDDNDAVADGFAMNAVLRDLGCAPLAFAFGQSTVTPLRREEWSRATARLNTTFWETRHVTIEERIGLAGAAAGGAILAHGIASLRANALDPFGAAKSDTLLAWAIDRDGTRGGVLATVERS